MKNRYASMDFTKIQNEVMKDCFNNHQSKYFYGSYETENGKYHGLTDGHMIVIIPDIYYYINDEKVFNKPPFTALETIVKAQDEQKTIVYTGEMLTVSGMKKPLMIFKNEAGEKIYIDSALHDNFKTDKSILYKGTTPKAPIYLYVYDSLIGVILPVNHKEKED